MKKKNRLLHTLAAILTLAAVLACSLPAWTWAAPADGQMKQTGVFKDRQPDSTDTQTPDEPQPEDTQVPDEPQSEDTQTPDEPQPEDSGSTGLFKRKPKNDPAPSGDTQPEGAPSNADIPYQLTEADISAMNNGDFTMLYSESGYLTFLRGKYYEEKITDQEDGIKSLFGMQSLLGITRGSEFFCVYIERDPFGYTYYTYEQRFGDITLLNAVLKIIVDPDGYAAGLVSSFVPNVGIAPENESAITKEEAVRVVQQYYPDLSFRFYVEDIRQTSITRDGVAIHCWAVFTNVPLEGGMLGDRRYMEHLVSYSGNYEGYIAVVSTKEIVPGDDLQYAAAMSWFDGKTADTYTAVVTTHDGTKKELTLPVVQDPSDGMYYLADLERHILVADYYSYEYEGRLEPYTSTDNTGWPEHYLLTYDSYIKVYDFYDSFGMTSVDGFGMPILILADCCEYDRYPIDNAFFAGFDKGWALFGASAVNDYGECIDVIGHEFTHGITRYTLCGDLYENESGAVNEAISDIMGNICEMLLQETQDPTWQIAENTGNPLRSMQFPWLFKDPVQVGGTFYVPTDQEATSQNDLGGIHTNSSLINHIAWGLYSQGLSLVDSYYLWREVINLLTPTSGFREVHHALYFAAEILQMDVKWLGIITMLCEQAGFQ